MRRLFDALDVDYDQWRALTRMLLRMDMRVTKVHGVAANTQSSTTQTPRLLSQGILYFFMGAAIAGLIFYVADPLLSGTIALTYVMFMVGLMVLVDHQSVITSPDDYLVLGSRPVSSRTYFAVRLSNVFVYTLTLTTVYGVLPMLAFSVAHGFHPLIGLASVAAFYASTTFVALVLVFSYAWMLRIVGAGRLARMLSYLQVVMGILLYAGYMLPGEVVRRAGTFAMPKSFWVLLYPPTWFASYLSIAAGGDVGWRQIVPAVGSLAAIALLARGLGGRLSLDYTERLGAIASATAAATPGRAVRRRLRPWLFRTGERRVVSLLVRGQFRNDQKFRMAVLGILPMTVVYMYLSFRDGPPGNPFSGAGGDMMNWTPLTMAVMFFPVMLRSSLSSTDAYRAAWIYFGTPVSRAAILRAQTDVLLAAFVVPYLAVVAAAMGYFTGHPAAVATHVLFLGLASRILLQLVTVAFPVLPFSQPQKKLGQSGGFFGLFFGVMIAAFALGPLLVYFVYVSRVRTVLVALLFVLLSIALDRLTRVRIGEDAEQLEFTEA